MRFLTREEVLRIHSRVLDETPKGIPRHAGVRHLGAVEAAADRARWGPFEVGDLAERAALLLRGIAQDHPFEDGNKRTAYACAFVFLDLNGAKLAAEDAQIARFMSDVGSGTRGVREIAHWIREHMVNV